MVTSNVKANQRIAGKDLRGLVKLRDMLGERLVAGVAFSTGERSYSTDEDRIHVLPRRPALAARPQPLT